jgi:hypothetical protein
VFTLPICLCHPDSPGYPPADATVHKYFTPLLQEDHSSRKAHITIASFIAAAHGKMLDRLKIAKEEQTLDGRGLLEYWHNVMESQKSHDYRVRFFSEVVEQAHRFVSDVDDHAIFASGCSIIILYYKLMTFIQSYKERKFTGAKSLPRDPEMDKAFDIREFTSQLYKIHTEKATKDLSDFLSTLDTESPGFCVTYFDEAHQLEAPFWVLMLVLSFQNKSIRMWCVVMGTRSSFQQYNPLTKDSELPIFDCSYTSHSRIVDSLRLRDERRHLMRPYIAMGFDQRVIGQHDQSEIRTINKLWGLEHLCKYRRPLFAVEVLSMGYN